MKLQRKDFVIHRSEILENMCLGKSLSHARGCVTKDYVD